MRISQKTVTEQMDAADRINETDNMLKQITQLTKERDELATQLKELRGHIRCIYCNEKYTAEQSGELADHIMTCEKSPLVQMLREMDSRIIDHMDMVSDEFQRILAITDNQEIIGICERAQKVIEQKEPVIKQRDDAVKECDTLKILLAEKNETANTFMNQVKKLHVERDQLAAKCSAAFIKLDSVKATLAYVSHQRLPLGNTVMDTLPEHWQLAVHKALDRELSDFGVGWLSPEKARRLREALDNLLVHAIEFHNDWAKGDFALPKLAECDMQSMASKFQAAKQALEACQ